MSCRGPVALSPHPSHQSGTGLDGFRKALDRARREALQDFLDGAETAELIEHIFDRTAKSLGI